MEDTPQDHRTIVVADHHESVFVCQVLDRGTGEVQRRTRRGRGGCGARLANPPAASYSWAASMAPALLILPLVLLAQAAGEGEAPADAGPDAGRGLWVDAEARVVALAARVLVVDELLEYLLVAPHGATHESLFVTETPARLLNAALLATGTEPGENARWVEPPSKGAGTDEPGDGRVVPPEGDGFLLWVAWREGDELYRFRVEDVLVNLEAERRMRRHRWVFLGSRFAAVGRDGEERFLAEVEGNLVNVSFFFEGNTLVSAALPQCVSQTIWLANAWLLPPRDAPVRLFFARGRLDRLPEGWAGALPDVGAWRATRPDEGR